MASRFPHSSLHQRDPRASSSLFDSYGGGSSDRNRQPSRSPGRVGGYGFSGSPNGHLDAAGAGSYRAATPNSKYVCSPPFFDIGSRGVPVGSIRMVVKESFELTVIPLWGWKYRGQYSDAVLSSLESQNETEIEGMHAKVKMLKDITIAIGDEIRDSSALAEKMNDTFDNTRVRLRGTMNRMLVMAEKTGVGWRVWLGFFCAVFMLFTYVWLF
ncbi:protein transport protein bet1 [Onygenales sp. PD_10]|nr:protein transport protein bet1 [Onygenales sp. PD_10]